MLLCRGLPQASAAAIAAVLRPAASIRGRCFVLVSAMIHGITEKRAAALRDLVGVSKRTLERWRRWWRDELPQSRFWRVARGRFASPLEPSSLPASLLQRFGEPGQLRLCRGRPEVPCPSDEWIELPDGSLARISHTLI